jgi:phage shock protein PspC (stress-responsive transcriptional regulator)
MKKKNVRIFFIYSSFFALGFGFFMYLTLAFWLRIKDLISAKRSSVFDL